jgi:uncharacterized membrane protein YkoI
MQLRTLCLGALCAALVALPAAEVSAQPGHKNGQGANSDNREQQRQHERQGDHKQRGDGDQMGAQQAARQAQQHYGGRVLKVDRHGSGYDVRLLQDDGRVITVNIGD